MATVQEHYDRLLADVYGWMLGDFETVKAANRAFFEAQGLAPASTRLAVDLGAGTGAQAVPLAELGYEVVALDLNHRLLQELAGAATGLAVQPVEADLLAFRRYCPRPPELVVCMGDTLPHLPTFDAVDALLADVAEALEPGGQLVLGFRDYASAGLEGISRFIPVRSDEHRILTCFLEYEPETVQVTDLLHTRESSGWTLSASSYRKLRIDPKRLEAHLEVLGLSVRDVSTPGGMIYLAAQKPP